MGVGRLVVSFEMLHKALALPPDAQIRFVGTADYNHMAVVVEHPSIPHHPLEHEVVPVVSPESFMPPLTTREEP